ncbi:MAG: hypothetical protein Q4F57_02390, partial [Weeksellaceae bacterium]|nr:hypothetical protein [Weeksellaceae bacterium]
QPYPALDREVYEIVYNTTEDTFIGHTLISVTGALSPVTFTPLWAGNAGFEITPTAHHLQTSIQRTEHIASILTTPGVYDYEFSVSRNGIIYSIATIRVQVVGYMHLLRTNISSRENFCLDKNYIRLTKSASDVDRVRMTLYMQFQRRNEQPTLITQDYEYVFMQDELIIYPGQEIHDFFEDIRVDDAIPELANQGPGGHTVNHMSLRFLYSLCSVSIILQEYNSGYGAHARHEIKETHWIAGKRPVAYPYLTSSRLRRSYDASLISLCAVSHRFSAGNLHHIAAGTVDAAVVSEPNRIVQLMFRRNQSSYAPLSILSHLNLKIEPGVNVLNPIDVIFQNQNHVADWFTFAKPHTRETEMEFVLTHNLVRNVRAKANTEETRKITLNTGWFFAEELVVLEELIKSPIAYIRIQRDWYQAIPISKRPLHYDSERNLHQQLVEFQIVEND